VNAVCESAPRDRPRCRSAEIEELSRTRNDPRRHAWHEEDRLRQRRGRKIPDGFSRETAWKQIIDFATLCVKAAEPTGIIVVAEPLNRGESNVMNSAGECAKIVTAVNHPNFRLLVDSYHFWLENDSGKSFQVPCPQDCGSRNRTILSDRLRK
jgi:hypothetical protein